MRPYILCSLLAFSLLMASCLQQKEQPVSKEEALVFGKNLDSAIAAGDETYFMKQVNLDVLFERMKENSDIQLSSGMKRGMKDGFKSSADIGKQIILETGNGKGSYSMVRHYEKDKRQHVIFRLFGDQGLNYHDFELIKLNNKVYIADFLMYITGENFSQSLADLAEGILEAEKNKNSKGGGDKLSLIRRLVAQEKYREAKRVYEGMPLVIRKRKTAQIIHLKICSGIGIEEYEKALANFESKYKNEPTMQLTFLDIYFMRKDFAGTINVVDRVDSMLGGDPFLDYYRGVIYYNWEKPEQSREALEKLYKSYPGFASGIIELIHNYLKAGDYEKARTVISAYRENNKLDQEMLETNLSLYPDFKE